MTSSNLARDSSKVRNLIAKQGAVVEILTNLLENRHFDDEIVEASLFAFVGKVVDIMTQSEELGLRSGGWTSCGIRPPSRAG